MRMKAQSTQKWQRRRSTRLRKRSKPIWNFRLLAGVPVAALQPPGKLKPDESPFCGSSAELQAKNRSLLVRENCSQKCNSNERNSIHKQNQDLWCTKTHSISPILAKRSERAYFGLSCCVRTLNCLKLLNLPDFVFDCFDAIFSVCDSWSNFQCSVVARSIL